MPEYDFPHFQPLVLLAAVSHASDKSLNKTYRTQDEGMEELLWVSHELNRRLNVYHHSILGPGNNLSIGGITELLGAHKVRRGTRDSVFIVDIAISVLHNFRQCITYVQWIQKVLSNAIRGVASAQSETYQVPCSDEVHNKVVRPHWFLLHKH